MSDEHAITRAGEGGHDQRINRAEPMRIKDLQQRIFTIGKIRLGLYDGAPKKLDTFRLTSPDRKVLEAAAALYGGEVREWSPLNDPQRKEFELITAVKELPFLISPVPVSQAMEEWGRGVCKRRCDTEIERISGKPCICLKQNKRVCKPVTRFNVVLYQLPGFGVWLLESHGWTMATELTTTADLLYGWLKNTRKPIPAKLAIEMREIKRVKKSGEGVDVFKFPVAVIKIEHTPLQLLSLASKPQVDGALSLEQNVDPASTRQALEQGETDLTGNFRGKYFALSAEMNWPKHEGIAKRVNYVVWSKWLERNVDDKNGASKFSDKDWLKLIEYAEACLDQRLEVPSEFDLWAIGEHPLQLQ